MSRAPAVPHVIISPSTVSRDIVGRDSKSQNKRLKTLEGVVLFVKLLN